MATQIQCTHCGQVYGLNDAQVPQYSGQTITCTKCKQAFTVPKLNAPPVRGMPPAYPPPAAAHMQRQAVQQQAQAQTQTKAPPRRTPPIPPAYPQPLAPTQPVQPAKPVQAVQPAVPVQAVKAVAPPQAQPQPPLQSQPPAQPEAPKEDEPEKADNGMATASVVCASIGFAIPFLPSILGFIFGIIGLKRSFNPTMGGKGLAIVGICLSAVSFVAVPGIYFIGMPAFYRAKETANRVKCSANMKTIGLAILQYAADNRGAFPARLEDLLLTQDITSESFVCPSSNDKPAPGATGKEQAQKLTAAGFCSYIYVGRNLRTNASPDTVVLYEPLNDHKNEGCNMLFADGHVDWVDEKNAQQVIAQLKAGQNPPRR